MIKTEQTLYQRAQAMTGATLESLAEMHAQPLPKRLHHDKGWIGHLIELQLGAQMGSASGPDFPALGVELKTVPVDRNGAPLESTYICTAPFDSREHSWKASRVYHKIARILWIPVEGCRDMPIGNRRIGPPLLWSPDPAVEMVLQKDWEELTAALALGEYQQLSARQGVFLHIRPKAAHTHAPCQQMNSEGEAEMLVTRGYYLRRTFTQRLLENSWTHREFFREK